MRIAAFEINAPVPELKEPHALVMLRPWVDVGSVGSLVLNRMERHLGARELGKLARPGTFFDYTRYRPTMTMRDGKRDITTPNSFINYAQPDQGQGFLFFHLLEPHMFGEDYCDAILELLRTFNVTRYALIGAMYDAVPHTRPLQITGAPSEKTKSVKESTYQGPTTITYLVTQRAQDAGIDVTSLIVHLPQYVQLDEDFTGVARVMEVLRDLYGLPSHLIDYKRGNAQYEEINKAVSSKPGLEPVIKQLEAVYDAQLQSETKGSPAGAPLSSEIEEFLQEMDDRFKGSGD